MILFLITLISALLTLLFCFRINTIVNNYLNVPTMTHDHAIIVHVTDIIWHVCVCSVYIFV